MTPGDTPVSALALTYAITGGSAAAVGLAVTPVVRAVATRLGAVDDPGGRRVHAQPVPRLGGMAVLAAMLAAFAIGEMAGVGPASLLLRSGWQLGALVAGVALIAAVGVVDDFRGATPWLKLAIELAAALAVLAGGYGFRVITNPFTGAYIDLGVLGGVATVLWIVAVTNAFNLIDGLDGLAAGVALIAAVTMCVVALVEGRPDAALLAVVLAGALAGFLPYNFYPASIFLGDSGSLLLGFVLSVLSIQGVQKGPVAIVILVPVFALGVPLMETIVTVARRWLVTGISTVFHADREHIHHRLVSMGMTQRRAVLVLYAACALLGGLAFLVMVLRGPANALVVGVVAVATYLAMRRLGYPMGVASRAVAHRVLIYGAQGSAALLRQWTTATERPYEVVGVIDDRPALWGQRWNGIDIIGGGEQLEEIVRRQAIEQVWLALPELDRRQRARLAARCAASGAQLVDRLDVPTQ